MLGLRSRARGHTAPSSSLCPSPKVDVFPPSSKKKKITERVCVYICASVCICVRVCVSVCVRGHAYRCRGSVRDALGHTPRGGKSWGRGRWTPREPWDRRLELCAPGKGPGSVPCISWSLEVGRLWEGVTTPTLAETALSPQEPALESTSLEPPAARPPAEVDLCLSPTTDTAGPRCGLWT